MRVRFHANVLGFRPGDVADVDDDKIAAYVDGGYASPYDGAVIADEPEAPEAPDDETDGDTEDVAAQESPPDAPESAPAKPKAPSPKKAPAARKATH